MKEKVRVLKFEINQKDLWEVIGSFPSDIVMTTLGFFMDLDRKVIHIDFPDGKKVVVLCIEKQTLIAIHDKAQSITDEAFIDMFDEVFLSEEEILRRQDFVDFLRHVISDSDPVIMEFIQ